MATKTLCDLCGKEACVYGFKLPLNAKRENMYSDHFVNREPVECNLCNDCADLISGYIVNLQFLPYINKC